MFVVYLVCLLSLFINNTLMAFVRNPRFSDKSDAEHNEDMANESDDQLNDIPSAPTEITGLDENYSTKFFINLWSGVCNDYPCQRSEENLSIFIPEDSAFLFAVPQDAPNPFHLNVKFRREFLLNHLALSRSNETKITAIGGAAYNLNFVNDTSVLVNGAPSFRTTTGQNTVYIMKDDPTMTPEYILKGMERINVYDASSSGLSPPNRFVDIQFDSSLPYFPCDKAYSNMTFQQFLMTTKLHVERFRSSYTSDVSGHSPLTTFVVLDEDLLDFEVNNSLAGQQLYLSHTLPGLISQENLTTVTAWTTLANTTIKVDKHLGGYTAVNGVPIICENIRLKNSVIHIIDGVIPQTAEQQQSPEGFTSTSKKGLTGQKDKISSEKSTALDLNVSDDTTENLKESEQLSEITNVKLGQ